MTVGDMGMSSERSRGISPLLVHDLASEHLDARSRQLADKAFAHVGGGEAAARDLAFEEGNQGDLTVRG
jgi:hypothetical protein